MPTVKWDLGNYGYDEYVLHDKPFEIWENIDSAWHFVGYCRGKEQAKKFIQRGYRVNHISLFDK